MKFLSSFVFLIFIVFTTCFGQEEKDTIDVDENASFYHDRFQGQETSNGEFYNKNDFTAAHKTFPFDTYLLVTNKKNERCVVVRINDRGPFKKSRVVDLTRSAAMKIEMVPFGVVPVKTEILTYLDRLDIDDSIFVDQEVWDCYANKISTNNETVFIWKTGYWKHAFYMASTLALETKMDSIGVLVKGTGKNKSYTVLATGIKTKKEANNLVLKFRKMGFIFCSRMPKKK